MKAMFDREELDLELGIWAKALAARAIAEIIGVADDRVLAQAMELFPAVIREYLGNMMDQIEDPLNGYVTVTNDTEQTEFTVQLDSFGPEKKIPVIKAVREITFLGLKEAKDLVEAAPKAVIEKVSKPDAEKFKKLLEDVGGKVSLK
jgi:ribosomal protein L7/L12